MEKELQTVSKGKRQVLDKHDLNTSQSQIEILQTIINIYKKCVQNEGAQEKCLNHANFLLEILFRQKNRITEQETIDFQLELTRYEKFVQICNIESEPNFTTLKLTKSTVLTYHQEIWSIINSIEMYSTRNDHILESLLTDLRKLVNTSMTVTPEEKRMIHKAMGMAQGHWFKCPNGHIYCIGDCGGAMQVSSCNECGAKIGGQSHQLLDTNTLDRTMDGTSHAAWSEQANLANYRF